MSQVNKTNKTNKNKKDYFKKFVDGNKDKVKEQVMCDVCGGSYTYFNKSHHKKSQRHLKSLQIIQNKDMKIKELEDYIFTLKESKDIEQKKIERAYEIITDDILENGLSDIDDEDDIDDKNDN